MRRIVLAFAAALTLAACGANERAVRADPELDALFEQLQEAADADSATPIQDQIMAKWSDSGSPTVDILLERATAAAAEGDEEMAEGFLDQATALAPDFAEPWRLRANIAYGAEDYAGAISAIEETLRREPRHFGAMAGLGLIYEEIGQPRRALEAYRAALVVHPHYDVALEGVRRLEPRVDGRDA